MESLAEVQYVSDVQRYDRLRDNLTMAMNRKISQTLSNLLQKKNPTLMRNFALEKTNSMQRYVEKGRKSTHILAGLAPHRSSLWLICARKRKKR